MFPMPAVGQGGSMVGCESTQMQGQTSAQFQPSQPAMIGAGPLPQAFASNVGNQAWIYTSNPASSSPVQTTGNISISAIAANQRDVPNSGSRASVSANLTYPPGGSQWQVQFTCLEPTGDTFAHYGGVGINKPVFGPSMSFAGLSLPQTNAYVVVFGRARITKDSQVVAENQPAIALVSQALHDVNNTWLSTPDANRQEISLIVPGSLQANGQPIPGLPNGFLYVYWPSASFQISSTGGTLGGATSTTGSTTTSGTTTTGGAAAAGPPTIGNALFGAGPAVPVAGSNAPVGTLTINLTDQGPQVNSSTTIPGLYDVTVTNSSGASRGVELTGIDLCCSVYKRFSSVLRPGQSQSFRWFFAPGRVTFRSFSSGTKTGRAFSNVRYTGNSTTLTIQ